jgi:alginate O-acetyltransferase complex protein AlgI
MWLIAFSLYAGCKWLTYKMALRQNLHPARWRRLAYLFAYTGMNAAGFLDKKKTSPQPRAVEWLAALAKIFSGVILLYGITRHLLPVHPWSAGWTGMVGIILILHFGLFHCLALVWQNCGVNAIPLMQSPLRATSLAEFWGRRWNTGFKELSLQFLFRPLQRRANIATTTLLVFGVSGLVHDLVISLPARGGYGLPTLYFLIQGGGLISERTPFARCLGFGHGWRGCLFTLLITTGPVFFLFHPPFIHHVILPMLHVIGAT